MSDHESESENVSDEDEQDECDPVPQSAGTKRKRAATTNKHRIGFGPDVSTEQMGKLVATDEYGEWRTVPGFPDDKVIVSSEGWVKMTTNGISLENAIPRKGYLVPEQQRHIVSIYGVEYLSYQLICRAFHGPQPTDSHTVDHINQKSDDNRASNLKWETKSGQVLNRRKRQKTKSNSIPILGKKIGSEDWVAYKSILDAALQLSLSVGNIPQVISGKRAHTKGYVFKRNLDASEPELLEGEVWVGVLGHESKYQVSNMGRFRSKGKGKNWKPPYTPRPSNNGFYAAVHIHDKQLVFHKVVFESFHKRKVRRGFVIDHMDSKKCNNKLSNLQEMTQSQNMQKEHDKNNILCDRSKISVPIVVWNAKTETLANARRYSSIYDASNAEKIGKGSIRNAFRRQKCNPVLFCDRYWKKVFSTHAPQRES